MLGKIAGVVIASSMMFAGAACASELSNAAALENGKPAGVEKANSYLSGENGLYLVGGAGVIAGIVLVATGDSHGDVNASCTLPGCTSTTTTTTTKPSTTTTTSTSTSTTTTTKTN